MWGNQRLGLLLLLVAVPIQDCRCSSSSFASSKFESLMSEQDSERRGLLTDAAGAKKVAK